MNRHNRSRQRPEAPAHAVAGDGIADLAADSEPDSLERILVTAVADEEHESGGRGSPTGVRREEIRPFLDDRERF